MKVRKKEFNKNRNELKELIEILLDDYCELRVRSPEDDYELSIDISLEMFDEIEGFLSYLESFMEYN